MQARRGRAQSAWSATLMRWLWAGQLRGSPGRTLAALAAVAIGVALGLSIHLVNRSALDAFGAAIAVVNGEAQAQVKAASAQGFDEAAWPLLAAHPLVSAASPVIELTLPASSPGGRPQPLTVIAIDPMRAAQVTPSLLPSVDESATARDGPAALFADDAVFLSAAAMQALQVRVGQTLVLRAGLEGTSLRVAGTVPGALPGQAIAVMDIGTAQWRLGWIGRLSRIDLRLAPAASPEALRAATRGQLPADLSWSGPDAARARMSNLSRAYRVNLDVLALVALFTGGFIVHSTIALGVVRRQQELALLGVLGAPRGFLSALVLGQGALIGAAGALLGAMAGIAIAAAMLGLTDGDLGGGYFRVLGPRLVIDPAAVLGFVALGIGVGLAGSAMPARAMRRLAPARAMKRGSGETTLARRHCAAWGALLALAGLGLLALPPLGGLPVAAYAAIAAWLFAGIAVVPLLARGLGRLLGAVPGFAWRWPALWLATRRIQGAPTSASAALAGVVASVALATAMAVMVHSFRVSVERWLDTVLPADLYGRTAGTGTPGELDAGLRARLAALPGVERVEFQRTLELSLDPARPAVMVLARPLAGDEARRLPLTGALLSAPAATVPIQVSEAMVDLYGLAVGRTVALPLGPADTRYFVAGVWRDYARQHGSIAIDAATYQRLTGDHGVNDIAFHLAPGADAQQLLEALRARIPELDAVEFRSASELRAVSLRIFDRSFAVTYALEAIAILVGLFGVAATYAGEAIARVAEFGMLRHLGLTRAGVARAFAAESALLILTGVGWGAAVGTLIALVLVHRVNPQSFHWTMDLAWPWPLLAASAVALVGLGVLAAVLASRAATGETPVRAVHADW